MAEIRAVEHKILDAHSLICWLENDTILQVLKELKNNKDSIDKQLSGEITEQDKQNWVPRFKDWSKQLADFIEMVQWVYDNL